MSVRSSVHSSLDGGSKKTKPKRKEIEQDRKHKNNPSEFKSDSDSSGQVIFPSTAIKKNG